MSQLELFPQEKPETLRRPRKLRSSTLAAKIQFLAKIIALSKKKGHCWASNAYFMKEEGSPFYGLSPRTISRYVSSLKNSCFVEVVVAPGGKRKITPTEAGLAVSLDPRKTESKYSEKPARNIQPQIPAIVARPVSTSIPPGGKNVTPRQDKLSNHQRQQVAVPRQIGEIYRSQKDPKLILDLSRGAAPQASIIGRRSDENSTLVELLREYRASNGI